MGHIYSLVGKDFPRQDTTVELTGGEISGLTFTRPKTLICLYILKTSLSLGSGGTHPSFQQTETGESFDFWASLVYRVSCGIDRALKQRKPFSKKPKRTPKN